MSEQWYNESLSLRGCKLLLLDLEPGVLEMVMATAGCEPASAGLVQEEACFNPPTPLLGKACNSSGLFI